MLKREGYILLIYVKLDKCHKYLQLKTAITVKL